MISVLVSILLVMAAASPAWCWWPRGHDILTRAAVRALPAEAPAFLRSGEVLAAHSALDPDVAKNRGTVSLNRANHPSHYFNLELLKGEPLPASRFEFGRLCARLDASPEQVGTLPYAAAEWTEQLALAFAEHRKWPDNPQIQSKCLVYGGILAHYAQEVCQPLNLTIHWNGRVVDGKSSNTRIHEKLDSVVQALSLDPDELAKDQRAAPADSVMASVSGQILKMHGFVGEALDMEALLLQGNGSEWQANPQVKAFGEARAKEAVHYTVVLWMTAWDASRKIRLPGYYNRAETDLWGAR